MTSEKTVATELLEKMVAQKPGGETRDQQLVAVRAVERAIASRSNLLLQAGTGTGKTFSYLIPGFLAATHGSRFVISTATKQLSEQIFKLDVPVMQEFFRKERNANINVELLKGRDNYACHYKFQPLLKMDDLDGNESLISDEDMVEVESDFQEHVDTAKEYQKFFQWVNKTNTGDRTEIPEVSDETWRKLSSNNVECVGSKCPFFSECFSEKARQNAKRADVVVTNHAIVGHDFAIEDVEKLMLGKRDFYVFDEAHERDSYMTSAWSQTLTVRLLNDTIKEMRQNKPSTEQAGSYDTIMSEMEDAVAIIEKDFETLESGLVEEHPLPKTLVKAIEQFNNAALRARSVLYPESENEPLSNVKTRKMLERALDAGELVLWDNPENVRSVRTPWGPNDKSPIALEAQPLRVGPNMMKALATRDAFMIDTSATISTGGNFNSAIRDLALEEEIISETGFEAKPRPYNTLDVGTPFDYKNQGMIYIPPANSFPAPEYKNIDEHSRQASAQMAELIKASNGSALVLTTKSQRVNELRDELRQKLPSHITIYAQGEDPNPVLIDKFKEDRHSVLIGTMGFWQGVDAPGNTCILVCIDKLPFATADNPIMKARKNYADQNGGNGFMQVVLPYASHKLSQAAGRLVRSKTDRGVVAIFDTRILTKRYGSSILKSLPQMRVFHNLETVKGALNRLSEM